MQSYRIGTVSEFQEGTKKVFNLGETEVGVFRLGEKFYAWNNICPHQGGPVCQGRLYPRVHENLDENKNSHGRLYDENNIKNLLQSYKKYPDCGVISPTTFNDRFEQTYNGGPFFENENHREITEISGDTCFQSVLGAAMLIEKKFFFHCPTWKK